MALQLERISPRGIIARYWRISSYTLKTDFVHGEEELNTVGRVDVRGYLDADFRQNPGLSNTQESFVIVVPNTEAILYTEHEDVRIGLYSYLKTLDFFEGSEDV